MSKSPSKNEELIRQLQRHHIAKKLPPDRVTTLAEFLGNLDKVSESDDGWSARCPDHADSKPSLSISVDQDGKILVCCHRGCDFEDIVRAAGMLVSEMFESAPSTRSAVLPPRRPRNVVPQATAADPSWAAKQALFCSHDSRPQVKQLADELSVTTPSLELIGTGWCISEKCWTFPERNGKQEICGILRRFSNGEKYAFKGGQRGLTLPSGWDESDAPLLICEGASDVAAAVSVGKRAIGRPGLKNGFNDLAILLKDQQAEIVMVADNDTEGVGRSGAKKLADRLSNFLKRPIDVMAPPKQYKDLREYLTEVVK
jgi:hypothetical protein